MVVVQQNSPEPMFFTVSLGTLVPIQKAVSGIVLLAYQSADERAHWLSETKSTKEELNYLKKAYPSVLKNGFFKQDSMMAHGVTELACPIFGHTGNAIATVSVPIVQPVSEKMNIEEYLPDVRETAFQDFPPNRLARRDCRKLVVCITLFAWPESGREFAADPEAPSNCW